jgi:gas vesicle protein
MVVVIALLVGLIIGIFVGHFTAIVLATETLTRSSRLYKELVARGDSAMAMLKHVHDKITEVESQPDRNKKRVTLENSMSDISKIIKGPSTTIDPKG